MLEARPSGWWGWHFALLEGDRKLAHIDLVGFRERGTITIGARTLHVVREGLVSGAFVLSEGSAERGRADKPSAWRDRFVIRYQGREYALRKRSPFSSAMEILADSGSAGALTPKGFLRRKVDVDVPGDWPLELTAFALLLAMFLWKRDDDAGAASTAS